MGLEVSAAKIRLSHTLELKEDDVTEQGFDGKIGFNFLGFTIQSYKSKYQSAKSTTGKTLGFKTLILPAKEKMKAHQKKLHDIILKKGKGMSQDELIKILNPVITGWSRYFGRSDANNVGDLLKMDYLLYLKLRQWSKRKTGSSKNGLLKYWRRIGERKWVFATEMNILVQHIDYAEPINKYTKVKSDASPFDGNTAYWAMRSGKSVLIPPRKAYLLRKQRGLCAWCKEIFTDDDVMEVDHIIPTSLGGKDSHENLQLLHGHCHDIKTAMDGSLGINKR